MSTWRLRQILPHSCVTSFRGIFLSKSQRNLFSSKKEKRRHMLQVAFCSHPEGYPQAARRKHVNHPKKHLASTAICGGHLQTGIAGEVHRKCRGTEYRQVKNTLRMPPYVAGSVHRKTSRRKHRTCDNRSFFFIDNQAVCLAASSNTGNNAK